MSRAREYRKLYGRSLTTRVPRNYEEFIDWFTVREKKPVSLVLRFILERGINKTLPEAVEEFNKRPGKKEESLQKPPELNLDQKQGEVAKRVSVEHILETEPVEEEHIT